MARPSDRGRDREDGEGTGWVLDPKVPVRDAPVEERVAVALVQRRVEEQIVRVEAVVERAPGEQEGRDAEDDRKQQRAGGGTRRRPTFRSEGLRARCPRRELAAARVRVAQGFPWPWPSP